MFYSQFVLAKKGPLGTIWIAAHLERKLRKNQVADTDIGVSVDSILSPDVPIALRLSSHLLLGVVKIYSRKVNYLFHDCSETLLKIKQAFRSTVVDLPPEESTAPYHSITLPETFDLDDFELPDNDLFQGNFVDHHISTRDQITLQDSMDMMVNSTCFGPDERFGDGDTSQIGLDLDENFFTSALLPPGHAPSLLIQEPRDVPQSSAPAQTDTDIAERDADKNQGHDFCTRNVNSSSINFPDLCEPFGSKHTSDPSGGPNFMGGSNVFFQCQSSGHIGSAQAPSTPSLVEGAIPAYLQKFDKALQNDVQTDNSGAEVHHQFSEKCSESYIHQGPLIKCSSPDSVCIQVRHYSPASGSSGGVLEIPCRTCKETGVSEHQISSELQSVKLPQTGETSLQEVATGISLSSRYETISTNDMNAVQSMGSPKVAGSWKENGLTDAHKTYSSSVTKLLQLEDGSWEVAPPPAKKMCMTSTWKVSKEDGCCYDEEKQELSMFPKVSSDLNNELPLHNDIQVLSPRNDLNLPETSLSNSHVQTPALLHMWKEIFSTDVQKSFAPKLPADMSRKIARTNDIQPQVSQKFEDSVSEKLSEDSHAESSKPCYLHETRCPADVVNVHLKVEKALPSNREAHIHCASPSSGKPQDGHSVSVTPPIQTSLTKHSCELGWLGDSSVTKPGGNACVPSMVGAREDKQNVLADANILKHLNPASDSDRSVSACPLKPFHTSHDWKQNCSVGAEDAMTGGEPTFKNVGLFSDEASADLEIAQLRNLNCQIAGEAPVCKESASILYTKKPPLVGCNHSSYLDVVTDFRCSDAGINKMPDVQHLFSSGNDVCLGKADLPERDVELQSQANILDCLVPTEVASSSPVRTLKALQAGGRSVENLTCMGTSPQVCPASVEIPKANSHSETKNLSSEIQHHGRSSHLETPGTSVLAVPAQPLKSSYLLQQNASADARSGFFEARQSIVSYDKYPNLGQSTNLGSCISSDLSAPEIHISTPDNDSRLLMSSELSKSLASSGQSRIEKARSIVEEKRVNRCSDLSARKRKSLERTPDIQDERSSKSFEISRARRYSTAVREDDDELSSILGGKSLLLKRNSTPLSRESFPKRTRVAVASRFFAPKRKVLMDDAVVMHGDSIRQQLTSTEDIRRVRRKAPCTCHEIWMIDQLILGEDMFDKPLLSGVSYESFDLSKQQLTEEDYTSITSKDGMGKVDANHIATDENVSCVAEEPAASCSQHKSIDLVASSSRCDTRFQMDLQTTGSDIISRECQFLGLISDGTRQQGTVSIISKDGMDRLDSNHIATGENVGCLAEEPAVVCIQHKSIDLLASSSRCDTPLQMDLQTKGSDIVPRKGQLSGLVSDGIGQKGSVSLGTHPLEFLDCSRMATCGGNKPIEFTRCSMTDPQLFEIDSSLTKPFAEAQADVQNVVSSGMVLDNGELADSSAAEIAKARTLMNSPNLSDFQSCRMPFSSENKSNDSGSSSYKHDVQVRKDSQPVGFLNNSTQCDAQMQVVLPTDGSSDSIPMNTPFSNLSTFEIGEQGSAHVDATICSNSHGNVKSSVLSNTNSNFQTIHEPQNLQMLSGSPVKEISTNRQENILVQSEDTARLGNQGTSGGENYKSPISFDLLSTISSQLLLTTKKGNQDWMFHDAHSQPPLQDAVPLLMEKDTISCREVTNKEVRLRICRDASEEASEDRSLNTINACVGNISSAHMQVVTGNSGEYAEALLLNRREASCPRKDMDLVSGLHLPAGNMKDPVEIVSKEEISNIQSPQVFSESKQVHVAEECVHAQFKNTTSNGGEPVSNQNVVNCATTARVAASAHASSDQAANFISKDGAALSSYAAVNRTAPTAMCLMNAADEVKSNGGLSGLATCRTFSGEQEMHGIDIGSSRIVENGIFGNEKDSFIQPAAVYVLDASKHVCTPQLVCPRHSSEDACFSNEGESFHAERNLIATSERICSAEDICGRMQNAGASGLSSGALTEIAGACESRTHAIALITGDVQEFCQDRLDNNTGSQVRLRQEAADCADLPVSLGDLRENNDYNLLKEDFSFMHDVLGANLASAGDFSDATKKKCLEVTDSSGFQDLKVMSVSHAEREDNFPLNQLHFSGFDAGQEGMQNVTGGCMVDMQDHALTGQNQNLQVGNRSISGASKQAVVNNVDFELEENGAGFLKVDDINAMEGQIEDISDNHDADFFESSGWSFRTRAVARYLKCLFLTQMPCGVITVDGILAGRTRKEASRMFFETLVLKTRDYINIEQEENFGDIKITPKAKLLKSNF